HLGPPASGAGAGLPPNVGAGVPATGAPPRGRLAAARRRGGGGEVEPCGIDVARVRAAAGDRPADGAPLIFAGRLLDHKRLDLALRAVQILARGEGESGAGDAAAPLPTVFGEGPDRERLERLAGGLRLP